MANFTIRKAVPGDAEEISQLMKAAYAIYASRRLDFPDVSAGIDNDIRDHMVSVAMANGFVVGAIVLVLGRDFVQVANVAVLPGHTGSGLGRRLLALADDLAREKGKPTLRLSTHEGLPENIALYSHLGWQETGREMGKVTMTKTVS